LKYADNFQKTDFSQVEKFPEAHTINGQKVPPDGEEQPHPLQQKMLHVNGNMPIGLSYPNGQDFGPYIQCIGEGIHPYFMDLGVSISTDNIPFSCGNVHPHTALMLFALALNQRPQAILETGTFYGYSTFFLAQALKIWNTSGSMVYTIDPVQTLIADAVKEHPFVSCIEGRSEEILPQLLSQIEEVQFAFLDSYKRLVYKEFLMVDPYIPPGGIVVFHDTQFLNTGRTLYNQMKRKHSKEYETMLFAGTPHKDNPHYFFGNADDRGLLVCRKKEADPFLDVWDANSRFMEKGHRAGLL